MYVFFLDELKPLIWRELCMFLSIYARFVHVLSTCASPFPLQAHMVVGDMYLFSARRHGLLRQRAWDSGAGRGGAERLVARWVRHGAT